MPLFEFVCNNCQKPFEELVRSASTVDGVTCPVCGSPEVKKKISTFASKVAGTGSYSFGSSAASQAAACSTGGT